MDSNASSRKKGPKLFDGQTSNGLGDDKISSLPDCMIHHILSFLPTIQVGRTCVLSTRWRFLWKSTPSLYFSDEGMKITFKNSMAMHERFVDFVDRVFTLHDDALSLYKFRFEYRHPCGTYRVRRHPYHFKTWMSTLGRHRLVEFIIDTNSGDHLPLPHLLCHHESLSLLKVRMYCVISIPASICFSNLKHLYFEHIDFSSDELTREVAFHLPLLKEFVLKYCEWPINHTVNINAPSLTKLTLADDNYSPSGTEITLDAVSLISLSVPSTVFGYEYSLGYLPSLVNASLRVDHHSFDVVTGSQRLLECLTSIYNVKDLEVDTLTIEALRETGIITQLQTFSNLTSMEVSNTGVGFSGPGLIKLLSCMPNVESLSIDVEDVWYYDEAPWKREMVPHGFLSKLKSVEIKQLIGSEKELCLISYLLPRTLEKMTISLSSGLQEDPEKLNEILKWLLMSHRGSPGTSVMIDEDNSL